MMTQTKKMLLAAGLFASCSPAVHAATYVFRARLSAPVALVAPAPVAVVQQAAPAQSAQALQQDIINLAIVEPQTSPLTVTFGFQDPASVSVAGFSIVGTSETSGGYYEPQLLGWPLSAGTYNLSVGIYVNGGLYKTIPITLTVSG